MVLASHSALPRLIPSQDSLRLKTMKLREKRFLHPNCPSGKLTPEGKESVALTTLFWVSNRMVFIKRFHLEITLIKQNLP